MSPKSVVESILVVSCTKQPLFSVLQQFFSCISSSSLCLTVLDFISSIASYSRSLTPGIQYVVSPTALTRPGWHHQGRAVQGHATRAAQWQCRHPQRSHQLCPPRACRFCMTAQAGPQQPWYLVQKARVALCPVSAWDCQYNTHPACLPPGPPGHGVEASRPSALGDLWSSDSPGMRLGLWQVRGAITDGMPRSSVEHGDGK